MEDYDNLRSFNLQTLRTLICRTFDKSVQLVGTRDNQNNLKVIRWLHGLGIQARPEPLSVTDAIKLAGNEKTNFHVFISQDDSTFSDMKGALAQTNSMLKRRVRLLGHMVMCALDRNNAVSCTWNNFILYSMQLSGLSYMLIMDMDDNAESIIDILIECGALYIESMKSSSDALPDRLLVIPPISPTPALFMTWSRMDPLFIFNVDYITKVRHPCNQHWREGKMTDLPETEVTISCDPLNVAKPLQSLSLCFMSPPSSAMEEAVANAGAKVVGTMFQSTIAVFGAVDKRTPCSRHMVKILRMHKSLCVDAHWINTCILQHRMVALKQDWVLPRPTIPNVWTRDSAEGVQFVIECEQRELVEQEVKVVGGTVVGPFDDHDVVITNVVVPILNSKMRTRFCIQEYSYSNNPHAPCHRWYWHIPLELTGVSLEPMDCVYMIFLQNANEKSFWVDVIRILGGKVIPDRFGWEVESKITIIWDGFSPGFVLGINKQKTKVYTPSQLMFELDNMRSGNPLPWGDVTLCVSQLEYYSEHLSIQHPVNLHLDYPVSVSSARRLVEFLRTRFRCLGLKEKSMSLHLGSMRTGPDSMAHHKGGYFVDVLEWSQTSILVGCFNSRHFLEITHAICSYLLELDLSPVCGVRADDSKVAEIYGTWYQGEPGRDKTEKLKHPKLLVSLSEEQFRVHNRMIGSLAACNKTEISVERVFVDCQTTTNKGYCSKCISLLNDAPKGTGSQNTTLGFFRIGDMIELLSGDKVRVREPSHHSVVLTHKRFYTWEVGAVFFGSRCKSSFKSKAHRMETHNTVDELIGNIRDAIEDLHACEKIEHVTPTPKVFCCDACDNTTDPTLERLTFKRLLYPNRVSCEGKCGLALESSYVVRY